MERSLTRQMMGRFVLGLLFILVLATPLLYYLTTKYYAEDLMDLVKDYGIKDPDIDLSRDVMTGMFIQFIVILGGLLAVVFAVMQLVPRRLWKPFHQTLDRIRNFRVETGAIKLPEVTGVREFSQLNTTLNNIMETSARSYQIQKEFTENASHELQTPLAIVLNKIDNLLQDEHMTEHQAQEMQEMYQELRHLSDLSRSLLLLAKIENKQFKKQQHVDLCNEVREIMPRLESIAGDITITVNYPQTSVELVCNEALLVSLITNLVANAVRHNYLDGSIAIRVTSDGLTIANTSNEQPLDPVHIFSRFYRTKENQKGNGLGLAIVKSICDYHHWAISYQYTDAMHVFRIDMKQA